MARKREGSGSARASKPAGDYAAAMAAARALPQTTLAERQARAAAIRQVKRAQAGKA